MVSTIGHHLHKQVSSHLFLRNKKVIKILATSLFERSVCAPLYRVTKSPIKSMQNADSKSTESKFNDDFRLKKDML